MAIGEEVTLAKFGPLELFATCEKVVENHALPRLF
jgi:hypothetical protein